jgi:hypothetical protein
MTKTSILTRSRILQKALMLRHPASVIISVVAMRDLQSAARRHLSPVDLMDNFIKLPTTPQGPQQQHKNLI